MLSISILRSLFGMIKAIDEYDDDGIWISFVLFFAFILALIFECIR